LAKSSLGWMALGGAFTMGALHQGLMFKGAPGPGFLPLLTGLGLIVLSLFVLIPALAHRGQQSSEPLFPEPGSLRKLISASVALFGYGFALDYLGYTLTTFVFMFFVSRLIEPKRWPATALLALATAVLSYLLFVVLLDVQLPAGPLGF